MLPTRSWFKRYVNWSSLRTFGEFEILSRASLTILIVVPILAGVWSLFRLFANRYNLAASIATDLLQTASHKLVLEAEKIQDNLEMASEEGSATEMADPNLPGAATDLVTYLEDELSKKGTDPNTVRTFIGLARGLEEKLSQKVNDPNLPRTVSKLANDLDAFIGEHPIRPIRGPLPFTWAVLFFASLCVFGARWAYQVRAPQSIQEESHADFVSNRKDDYLRNSAEGSVTAAMTIIGEAKSRGAQLPEIEGEPDHRESPQRFREWKVGVVSLGADAKYFLEALKNRGSCFFAAVFYGIGILLLIVALAKQAYSVAAAAGWL